jgi:hypothetical protein
VALVEKTREISCASHLEISVLFFFFVFWLL